MQGQWANVPLHISLTYLDGENQVKRVETLFKRHLAGVAAADELVVLALLGVLPIRGAVLVHQVPRELLLALHGKRGLAQLAAEEAGRRPHLHLVLRHRLLLLLLLLLLWLPAPSLFLGNGLSLLG